MTLIRKFFMRPWSKSYPSDPPGAKSPRGRETFPPTRPRDVTGSGALAGEGTVKGKTGVLST